MSLVVVGLLVHFTSLTWRILNLNKDSEKMLDESAETNGESMRIDPQRAKLLAENIGHVYQRVQGASGGWKVCMTLKVSRNLQHSFTIRFD